MGRAVALFGVEAPRLRAFDAGSGERFEDV
jgi:hypothetical protein